ncbi:hypothetical protein JD844_002658 [Phrynosoma platyrhinos]|uniref:G-protein coupled receptors family 1 profile domain-containing protein n=1 Tax=Phrynosoma platyrhinos TaxID=52577 RepID=A0ABQ7TC10_PHRPL|nr:hypothetical protein JD844_002658 [Phrynosoma platyrhinos]
MTDIIWRFTGEFMAPDLVCRIVRYLQVVLLYASTYVLVSLSIDRYHAIVYPMKFFQGGKKCPYIHIQTHRQKRLKTYFLLFGTERQAKILIVVAWGLSFLFSIPTLIIFGKRKLSNGEMQCWAVWPDDSYWIPYMTTVAFLVYFIPLIIISSLMSGKALQETVNAQRETDTCPFILLIASLLFTDGKFCTSYTHRGLISKAKIKAVKYSVVIILGK